MSLIVLQHTVVDNFDVDPAFTVNSTNRILAGAIVGLDSNGYVALATNSTVGVQPLGIAGDSISDEYKTTAYSADLIVGRGRKLAGGTYSAPKRWTSNRVSDFFNETLSSGKMSVYTGAGRFATDVFVDTDQWSGSSGKKVYTTSAGKFTLTASTSRVVGYVLKEPTEYSSGVPGVDSPTAGEGSMSLGQFLQVQLSI